MTQQVGVTAKLNMRGTFVCKNAAGEVIKSIDFSGAIPLEKIGISVDEAKAIVDQSEQENGTDNRE